MSALIAAIAVPVRNEAQRLRQLLIALAEQRNAPPLGLFVFFDACTKLVTRRDFFIANGKRAVGKGRAEQHGSLKRARNSEARENQQSLNRFWMLSRHHRAQEILFQYNERMAVIGKLATMTKWLHVGRFPSPKRPGVSARPR